MLPDGHPVAPFTISFRVGADVEICHDSDSGWSRRRVTYDSDCLKVWEKEAAFLDDPRFIDAYQQGMDSGHHIGRTRGSRDDLHVEWRVHVSCWAATHACRLPGDFVECGVNTGILALAICRYIDFNTTGKSFYLFDTFNGIPAEQISSEERELGRTADNARFYEECFERTRRNFEPYPRAKLIRGRVPDSLAEAEIAQVCYLSLDMNIALPERAALEHFWPRLVAGAVVILDDYAWTAHRPQKQVLDEFARERGVEILTLPTGQGLLLKPPRR